MAGIFWYDLRKQDKVIFHVVRGQFYAILNSFWNPVWIELKIETSFLEALGKVVIKRCILLLYIHSEPYYPLFRVLFNGDTIFKLESIGSTNDKGYQGKCTGSGNWRCRTAKEDLRNWCAGPAVLLPSTVIMVTMTLSHTGKHTV